MARVRQLSPKKKKKLPLDISLFEMIEKLSRKHQEISKKLAELREVALLQALDNGRLVTLKNASYKIRVTEILEYSNEVVRLEKTLILVKARLAAAKEKEIKEGVAKKVKETYQLVRDAKRASS